MPLPSDAAAADARPGETPPRAEDGAPAGPAAGAPAGPGASARREGSFFLWVRSLGVVRHHGWLGGVCAGIADRAGVDPLIIRGVFVVAAVLGFPALWLYALGWALLPDERGRIPVRLRSGADPAWVGILATLAVALLVTVAGHSVLGTFAWAAAPGRFLSNLFEALFWLAVVGGIATVVIWLVRERRAGIQLPPRGDDGGVSGTAVVGGAALAVGAQSASPPPSSAPAGPLDATTPHATTPLAPPPGAFGEPPPQPPAPLTETGDLAAWKEQHAAWRAQHDEWRRRQADAERLAREEERARRHAERAAFAQEAARVRAERRAERPRISVAYGAMAVGAALIAAGATVAVGWQAGGRGEIVIAALCAAAAVLSLAMVGAGLARRRSGFLAALIGVLLIAAVSVTGAAVRSDVSWGSYGTVPGPGSQRLTHIAGDLEVALFADGGGRGILHLRKGGGTTYITVGEDVAADVRVETTDADVSVVRYDAFGNETWEGVRRGADGAYHWRQSGGAEPAAERTVRLEQRAGAVVIQRIEGMR
ncbi:hypothetical protein GCM10010921_28420 [Microbacterium album]|uniref:Phage shock protein PspC N-terminal domain-containing protein n=2 Tax=Microbacterium album TaxID=2053191 RepID=A0A917IJ29_9MICO|nr:hypothetical protein GCM10010921_28420 [Microbacterium album]